MHKALILHGTLGSPTGNWFTWLKQQLEAQGLEVWLPQLPHADQPSLQEWLGFVRANCPFAIDQDTLVVGHSSGAILALILAQQNTGPVGGIVAVSVFPDNALQWEPNDQLFDIPFDWAAIQKNATKLLIINSDNDPYVTLAQAQYVASHCKAAMLVIPGEGHFNLERSPDYRAFPRLLDVLQQRQYIAPLEA